MAFEKLAAEVATEIANIPKSERLEFLKGKIAQLPEAQRVDAEHMVGLTLMSLDHAPQEKVGRWAKICAFFRWTDLISLPLVLLGSFLVLSAKAAGEVEFNLTDMSVKTNSLGYFLIVIGVLIFLSRGRISRA